MAIYILTDSASDIDQNEYENVRVLPMTITIDGNIYHDGVSLSKNEFYHRLENSEAMPATTQVSPYQFENAYEKLNEGDEAIVITISAELSGTCQSAKIAVGNRENISVIDSMSGSAGEKLLVLRAMELASRGLSRMEIVSILEKEKHEIVLYVVVDTLKYLLKGGRVSKTSALVGGIIGIKPILTLEDGLLVPVGKARGSKQSHIFLNKKIQEVGGIDFSRPYAVGYSGIDRSNLDGYLESNQEILNMAPHPPMIVQIGSTVGTHAGPGTVLITFFRKS